MHSASFALARYYHMDIIKQGQPKLLQPWSDYSILGFQGWIIWNDGSDPFSLHLRRAAFRPWFENTLQPMFRHHWLASAVVCIGSLFCPSHFPYFRQYCVTSVRPHLPSSALWRPQLVPLVSATAWVHPSKCQAPEVMQHISYMSVFCLLHVFCILLCNASQKSKFRSFTYVYSPTLTASSK